MQDTPNILKESLLESIVKESPMIASFLTTGSGGGKSNMVRFPVAVCLKMKVMNSIVRNGWITQIT